jgi:predicted transcriptional regulator/transcriptional regulator with XRE-family HTH domain
MRKAFMGVRLKRLREERGLTQSALAKALDLSSSYLNQLEKNQRPLTVPILLKINAVFGVDVQMFSEDDEARLVSQLRDALSEMGTAEDIALAELRELSNNMPAVARAFLALHGRYRAAMERADVLAARFGDDAPAAPLMPFEEVRDFFYARRNHIDVLDRAAERIFVESGGSIGDMSGALVNRFKGKHGIRVVIDRDAHPRAQRRYEASAKTIAIAGHLRPAQQAFQLATQLAFIECGEALDELTSNVPFANPETRGLTRIGLANYFAGALILPYGPYLEAAEALRYDIEQLGRRFGVGFETACHRLSTLQRADAPGVPFFFARVDRAGNMSKRQSATDFHFSRVGGTCPLWNVYEAFANPGRVLVQLAEMPDSRTYLCVARTVSRGQGGYGTPNKTFAVALGCDLRHAERLVYSRGLDLKNREARTPIGVGCKICEREACPQRAFPAIGRPLEIDETAHRFAPYSGT